MKNDQMTDDFYQKLYEVVIKCSQSQIVTEQLNAESDLATIGINSLVTIKVIVELETMYSLEFDEDEVYELNQLTRLGEWSVFLHNKCVLH